MEMYVVLCTFLLVDYVIRFFHHVCCKLFTSVWFDSLEELCIKRCPEDNLLLMT